jgi:hypothetical protein
VLQCLRRGKRIEKLFIVVGSYPSKNSPFEGFYFSIGFLVAKNGFNGLFNEPFFSSLEEVV